MRSIRTTVELPDTLHHAVRKYAVLHGMTIRAVVEAGLKQVLASEPVTAEPFRLKRCAFKGEGVAQGADWADIRANIYDGHGERST